MVFLLLLLLCRAIIKIALRLCPTDLLTKHGLRHPRRVYADVIEGEITRGILCSDVCQVITAGGKHLKPRRDSILPPPQYLRTHVQCR